MNPMKVHIYFVMQVHINLKLMLERKVVPIIGQFSTLSIHFADVYNNTYHICGISC